jgi:uncharacterized protein Yka (UPF0111/DUF47 family)
MTRDWLSWVRSTEVLEDQAKNLVKATSSLVELHTHYDRSTESISKIRELEHEGDQITHNLFTIIDRTFITHLAHKNMSS